MEEAAVWTFEQAKRYTLRFGKYKGLSLDEAAQSDRGLLYLDWLLAQSWLKPESREPLEAYMSDKTISKEVERAMERC